ncbi:hypothetical protein IC232_13805 [Microvirga sp. BT688]|uniref:hypothetical protein n=1 Tax=Microvirga sp. TaxID=1873136 RepID=UPI001681D90B|nr:hypothetical protein [Microvirga sp.]MBD2747774.1 hypothetical protein [Microvirga sp.]
MTEQLCDRIRIDVEWHPLTETPLKGILDRISSKPCFAPTTSANWRGYTADWEIVDRQLFLVRLNGTLDQTLVGSLTREQQRELQGLLGSDRRPIFADWVSGTLSFGKGRWLEVSDSYWGTMSEFTGFIEIAAGEVTRQWEVDNRAAHSKQEHDKGVQKQSLLGINYDLGESDLLQARAALADPVTCARDWISSDDSLRLTVTAIKLRMGSIALRKTRLRRALYDLTRAFFVSQVVDRTILSTSDCAARRRFDVALRHIEDAMLAHSMVRSFREEVTGLGASLTETLRFVRFQLKYLEVAAELTTALKVPQTDEERLEWAIAAIKAAERYIEDGNFSLLGVALEAVEFAAGGNNADD